ncbi:MAG: hypothetical protein IPP17_30540 [Bacteroidetes bacterium]|nr:hypothetical protein [Bacteroidota bacterium]
MNKGSARATGDVIGILNADDFYTDTDVIFRRCRRTDLHRQRQHDRRPDI